MAPECLTSQRCEQAVVHPGGEASGPGGLSDLEDASENPCLARLEQARGE